MKSSINPNFESIDTPEKAYVLGFIAADGSMSKKLTHIVISISSKDDEILQKISHFLFGFSKVRHYREVYIRKGVKKDYGFSSALRLPGRDEIKKFLQWGIHPNKSYDLRPPYAISQKFISHWVRGYFDGDGGFSLSRKSLRADLTGTVWVNEWIAAHFREVYPNEKTVYIPKGKEYSRLSYGTNTAIEFAKWIYKGSTIHMERKFKIIEPFINHIYTYGNKSRWTVSEELLVAENYNNVKELQRLLPFRTRKSICHKLKRLGLLEPTIN